MMNKRLLPVSLSIVALAFIIGFWAGCTVGFDATEDGVFHCLTDDDCVSGFECQSRVCTRPTVVGPADCDDEDGDGFGKPDTDRSGCEGAFPGDPRAHEPDCDDTNRDIYPGAPEVCDGIDNNCDGNVDVVPCEDRSDCPTGVSDSEGNDITYRCESNRCAAFPVKQICTPDPCPECSQSLSCNGGILDTVPVACR
ncbi:MAG: putative metal-binding motif-containing protein [Bradymonadaceae bacterium]